jgi:hypothetical protein
VVGLDERKHLSKSLASIARTKLSTTAATVAASTGVIMPLASAEAAAFRPSPSRQTENRRALCRSADAWLSKLVMICYTW